MGFEAKPIGDDISWAVIAIVAALTVISVGLLYATAFVDPGFVPRDLEEESAEEGQVTLLRMSAKICLKPSRALIANALGDLLKT